MPTNFDPYPELLLVCTADCVLGGARCDFAVRARHVGVGPTPDRGSEDDGDRQDQRQRGNIDHVASDDAEIENLGVNPAHAIERRLLLPQVLARLNLALGVGLLHPPPSTASVKQARLLRLFGHGRGVRGRVADDSLEGDIGGVVAHVVARVVVQRLEALT